MRGTHVFALACTLAAAIAAAGGCSVAQEESTYALPDRDQFIQGGVSEFLEKRCGALDCHGEIGRPLRIYSQYGLRLAEGDGGRRDLSATTPAERLENFRSVIGLEPEELSQSVQSQGVYVNFMLFLKPLGIESGGVRHKGGPVLRASDADPGWVCLRTWVGGQVDTERCKQAAF